MANYSFKSNRSEVLRRMTENLDEAAEQLRQEAIEWTQEQMLYGYHDPHGPDGHTEIVDTGALFESIDADVKRDSQNVISVDVGTDKKYAVFVHQGTYKLRGRPFIRDALEKHRARIRAIMEENAKRGF